MSDCPSPLSSVTHHSDFTSDGYEFTSSFASPGESFLNNILRGEPFQLDTSFINRADKEKNPQVDTTVYDMRKCGSNFVKGETLSHKLEIVGLKQRLHTKYQTDDKCILLDSEENLWTCFIINEEQVSELQILISSPLAFEEGFSDVSGEVTRSVSVCPDSDVRQILTSYNDATESSMDSLYFHKASVVIKEGTFRNYDIRTFDRCKLFQDEKVDLRIHHYVDEKREMILHLQCLKSKNIGEIRTQLKCAFSSEFGHIVDQVEELWLSSGLEVLKDTDCIFLNECLESNNQDFTLVAQIGDTHSIPVCYYFQREKRMVLIPQTANIRDFRRIVSKMIHKPANSLKILYKKKKIDDISLISQFQKDLKRHILQVEVASEKVYSCVIVNMGYAGGEHHKMDICAYKLDTLSDLKHKVATCLQIDPFYLQLLLNASQTDENSTLHASKIRPGDIVQIVLFPNRVRICLRLCKGKRVFIIVDETIKTTISELKTFSGQISGARPADIIIIFKGHILDEDTMTLFDAGVVFGSVVTANSSSVTNQTHLQNVIDLFIAGGEGGIRKSRGVKVGGRIIQVDDSVQFDDPLGTSLPPIDNIHLKGLHIDNQQIQLQHSTEHSTDTYNTVSSLKLTVEQQGARVPSSDEVSSYQHNERQSSPSTCTTTVCLATSTSISTSSSCATIVSRAVNSNSQQSHSYIGDDLSTGNNDVYHCLDTRYAIYSANGTLIGKHCGQSTFRAPLTFYGPHRSVSDSALMNLGVQHPYLPHSLSLPEPRNAVSERVLDSLAEVLCNDWPRLGTHLGVPYHDMEKIKHDRQSDLKGQALSMLHRWKTQSGSEATAERLCEALRKCSLVSYAESIEKPDLDGNVDLV